MPTIEALTERIAPVSPDTLGREIFARFESEPETFVIPVVDGERPLGLIERDGFLVKFGAPFGHAGYAHRTAAHVMDTEPAVIEAGVAFDTFSDVFLSSRTRDLMRGFIVTREGRYHGVGTALSLLQAVNERQRRQNTDLKIQLETATSDRAMVQAAGRTRTRLLNVLSRQMSVPLNGLRAIGDLLQRQPLNAQVRAHVATMVEASDELTRTLDKALDFSRAHAGELELAPVSTPLRALMDDVQSRWSHRASDSAVSLMVSYEGDTDLAADLDAQRLGAVFDTLIGNALGHARDGLVEASLKATARNGQVGLEAWVRDDGPGIAPERLDTLFDPLMQQDDTGGFDLALARLVVTQMGGTLTAANNPGRGAVFTIMLTARQSEVETAAEPVQPTETTGQTAPHILIVDDNATNRVVAQALCEMFGCTSETAEDGVEAVAAVQERPFDLILMDIKMPRMDGVQATQAIRALDGPVSAIPIVALTANADPEDAKRYVASGMACVVEKPIKPERLRFAINTALEQKTASVTDLSPARSAA
ncbi:MAG: response regulator [Brevundimonas sp.]|uniref:response regulator n=1 Tax=Brevundimonas sp. TaxID=1871086 RepID=UPI001A2B5544|nr:response regulator [Brevundimonas sp.]MBJ7447307.1 response regulator [Brevundimonas sp.]